MKSGLPQALKWLISALMVMGCYVLGATPRTEFLPTFLLFSGLFLGMIAFFWASKKFFSWKKIFLLGLGMRLVVSFTLPNWSEDYARFLWDGKLLELGENPYAESPNSTMGNSKFASSAYLNTLLESMNSPEYYSVYPPLNQSLFWLASASSGDSIILGVTALRLILLFGEIGVFFLLFRLLRTWGLSQTKMIWYWLNPLVVLEIVGNVHFEGLVLMFLLASVLSFFKGMFGFSGGLWGLAAGLKLLPLILGPAFVFASKTKAQKTFWIGFFLMVGICFWPLLIGDSFSRFFESLQLYQGKFEFNASVYYVLREIGFWIQGYNIIGDLTKGLSVLTIGLIIFFSWKKSPKNDLELVDLFVLIYLIYLILQPVVHPWYILPGLGLSILAERKTFILWSFGAVFSYQAYGNPENWENPLLLTLEYGLVLVGIWMDYFTPKRNPIFEAGGLRNG